MVHRGEDRSPGSSWPSRVTVGPWHRWRPQRSGYSGFPTGGGDLRSAVRASLRKTGWCSGMPGAWKSSNCPAKLADQGGAGHRRRPWRLRCRHGEGRPGSRKTRLQRPRKDDFRLTPMASRVSFQRGGGHERATFRAPQLLLSQRAKPSPSWSAVLGSPHWTPFAAPACGTRWGEPVDDAGHSRSNATGPDTAATRARPYGLSCGGREGPAHFRRSTSTGQGVSGAFLPPSAESVPAAGSLSTTSDPLREGHRATSASCSPQLGPPRRWLGSSMTRRLGARTGQEMR